MKKILVLLIALFALFLSACSNSSSPTSPNNNTGNDSLIFSFDSTGAWSDSLINYAILIYTKDTCNWTKFRVQFTGYSNDNTNHDTVYSYVNFEISDEYNNPSFYDITKKGSEINGSYDIRFTIIRNTNPKITT